MVHSQPLPAVAGANCSCFFPLLNEAAANVETKTPRACWPYDSIPMGVYGILR